MNCFPTEEQTFLLQAGLLPLAEALPAWERYSARVDLEKADPLSTTFFPLVYRNLPGLSSRPIQICKSVYRHTWSRNQMLFSRGKEALKALQAASIPAALLKGAAMTLGYYRDLGLRALGDIDILVPFAEAQKALELLIGLGFRPKGAPLFNRSHALLLEDGKGNALDLHWRLFSEHGLDPLLAHYRPSIRTVLAPFPLQILQEEELLLHTLFHGMHYSPVPLIRWIADAALLLKKSRVFAWESFLAQAKRLKIELLVFSALEYLESGGFAQLPEPISTLVKSHRPSLQEKRHFRFLTRPPKAKLFFLLQLYWHSHRRNCLKGAFYSLLNLPRFAKKVRRLSRWRDLFSLAFRGLISGKPQQGDAK